MMETALSGNLLAFTGTDGFDVFNCSVPFEHGGQIFMYGAVEKRTDTHNPRTSLFRQTALNTFTLESSVRSQQIENPHVIVVKGEVVLGGTQVIKDKGDVLNCYTDMYRGVPQKIVYFTSGPDRCAHLRLTPLPDEGGIVVIAVTPDAPTTMRLATVQSFNDINDKIVAEAAALKDPNQHFTHAQSVIVTQVLALTPEHVGCVCLIVDSGGRHSVAACVVALRSTSIIQCTTLASRDSFPPCTPKSTATAGTLFPAGVVCDASGHCQLYCGVDAARQATAAISYPFGSFGSTAQLPTLPTCPRA